MLTPGRIEGLWSSRTWWRMVRDRWSVLIMIGQDGHAYRFVEGSVGMIRCPLPTNFIASQPGISAAGISLGALSFFVYRTLLPFDPLSYKSSGI